MVGNSEWCRSLPAILAALVLLAGCVTVDDSTPTTEGTPPQGQNPNTAAGARSTPTTEEATKKAGIKAGIEQWKCGDYFEGCGFFTTDCVMLTANLHNGTGEVKFGEFIERTEFSVQGLERRWDWCWGADGRSDCAFLISVGGKGSYYNFRGSDDGSAKPSDLFKCTRR